MYSVGILANVSGTCVTIFVDWEKIEDMQCVILAGGLGTRVEDRTKGVPKSLVEIEGRPFLDYQLTHMANVGVQEIVLCLGHLGAQIRSFVGDGSQWGLRVKWVDEGPIPLGTGVALRMARDQGKLANRFLLTYGDSYLPIDFRKIYDHAAPAVMAVLKNKDQWDESNVVFRHGRVALYSKRKRSDMEYIDYGLSALRQTVIEGYLPKNVAELLEGLSLDDQLAGYEVSERFYEVGSPEGIEDFVKFTRACQLPSKLPAKSVSP